MDQFLRGGRTSAYMTKWLIDNKSDEYEMVVVFANTGEENEATLQFVHDCDRYLGFNTTWLEADVDPQPRKGTKARVVTFETASRKGEPYVYKRIEAPTDALVYQKRFRLVRR